MQQTHNGNDKIKSMGIQETKLLALPSACAVKNATLTECPKLLGLSPNSPDAAIFTNASTAVPAASTTPAATGTGTSQSQNTKDASSGSTLVVGTTHPVGLLVMAVSAIALSAFP
ncbi:hypothetical protein TIFTF001_018416 [Ficus carica]|uniref:Uncharacterized protein n=1 Tax=Ficus carica TaxID=3494 RepID=A0AA88AB16_FICCA|nr:hypothetical protein TIFTF001_018416 [Ficus carica]